MIQLHDKIFKPYLSSNDIYQAIDDIAHQLNVDYAKKQPLFIGVLNGSFMFVSDLMKKLEIKCEISFVKVSSYSGTKSTGKVSEVIGLQESIAGRDIIVLEDIIDTGNTVEVLLGRLKLLQPSSIKIATLLFKPDVFDKNYTIDYVGKNIPNKFVVGFGLDYNGLGRNLISIYQLEEE